jgi:uncharacterized protein YlxW (UPF0749 family)
MRLMATTGILSTTTGIVAVAGGAVAIVALLVSAALALRLRRVRAQQRVVLGDRSQDLVSHAAELQNHFAALQRYVEDAATALDARVASVEDRLDRAIAHRALVRYDAYGEMSGRQSTSIALLDATGSGLVVSSIHHRDQARLYAQQIQQGQPEHELSPEENEAVNTALGRASQQRRTA